MAADLCETDSAVKAVVLGIIANDGTGVNSRIFSDFRLSGNVTVWPDPTTVPDFDVAVQDAVRTDVNINSKGNGATDDGGRMNHLYRGVG
jgi:hypothetical protein